MHKIISNTLFVLIHSMSKVEKKHFRLYACYHSKNAQGAKYMRLFDSMAKQKEYDEGKITNSGIIKKEHLPVWKHYLHNLILESLRVLRGKGDDIDSKISNLLENARIMRDKGFEDEEINFLTKAKQLAMKHERLAPTLDALLKEQNIQSRKAETKPWHSINRETETLLSKINNRMDFMKISREVCIHTYKSLSHRSKQHKALKKLRANPLLSSVNKAISLEAKLTYYITLIRYYRFFEENQNRYKTITQLKHLIESNLAVFENPDIIYSIVLNTLTIAQFGLGKYTEALSIIEKHCSLAKKSGPAKTHAWLHSAINETHCYMMMGEFEKGVVISKEIEKELNIVQPNYPMHLLMLYYNIANIYFGAGEYRKAMGSVMKVINSTNTSFREDMQAWCRIMQILIHYELNTPDIMNYLIVSTYRFLLKRKLLNKTEKSILRFIRRVSKIDASHKSLMEEFGRFRDELVQITKDLKKKKALDYSDLLSYLISWLESKIEGRAFAEVVRGENNPTNYE